MEKYEIESIYDQLCGALTDYETDYEEYPELQVDDKGVLLYEDIVRIVNEFAHKLHG